jgi:hypothetical protein
MSKLQEDAQVIEVAGATVDFYKYSIDGITYFQFDSSKCGHPEPMINAMSGLQLIDSEDKRLVMINSKAPMGLFPKIEADFDNEVIELEDGRFKIIFSKKSNANGSTNFTDTGCSGGGCSN